MTAPERARQAIIVAAGAQFALFGYEATSLSRITKAMGKPKSAIGYHQFPSKASLALAVIEQQQQRWRTIAEVIPKRAHLEYLATLLLTTSVEARQSPIAAGAIRLLHEAASTNFPVPPGFNWPELINRELHACFVDANINPRLLPTHAASLLLNASYGLLTSSQKFGFEEFIDHLKALWIPLFESFGFRDAGERINQVGPASMPNELNAAC
ncbi:TetR/AcrR family transcriptional regulator [Curtobacterium flaccumfaciens]|uniref:TetR/AcrR family transcriptional regulator n=1 Tax=Curtobacterium flaccumfaciens TaxID=2035 RepID=UPI0034634A92